MSDHDTHAHPSGAHGEMHDGDAHDHEMHDHDMHAMHHGNFKRLFWINLILAVPTLVFSTGLQSILGLSGPRFDGSQWIPAIFGAMILFVVYYLPDGTYEDWKLSELTY